ncbi:orotate phosphoribosyltransferase [Schinkia azotoformans]|uniref:Orotate phosphoribosyltransferase n=1 Tax=Schinkia azotoformans LMG 9581 TaxID=1131731 RepID=K6CCH9_SCHAZ|nr:orotate phosphoribosyltransferase [Schinkia azotoformans]EKN68850.1 orotate phosphoribosyltransferase [Schinkia azotoformans LMG 9581]MEC1638323.1 orotate phosphoribosyltransferase [Schinkia azotoformans]MEC1946243.1 orotate phosphoribosyltransferase [Schinkia azotoformans]
MKFDIKPIGAVHLRPSEPFTWSSGIKSPIYCDNRLTLSYPGLRKEIAKGLAGLIETEFNGCEVVAGTATAGIPHAAWVSDLLNLPMCYVRSKPKGHGRGNQIEGAVKPGQKVVVVEDLISTGGSVITAVEALREAGCEVLGTVAIFTYELDRGYRQLDEANIKAFALSDYSNLIEVALEKGLVSEAELEKLKEWRKNPEDESWMTL